MPATELQKFFGSFFQKRTASLPFWLARTGTLVKRSFCPRLRAVILED
jgi:hypothetical protein